MGRLLCGLNRTAVAACLVAVVGVVKATTTLEAQKDPQDVSLARRVELLEGANRDLRQQLDEIKTLLQVLLRPPDREAAIEVVQGTELSLATAAVRGRPGATLVLIEFSDFQCPFCGRYAHEAYPRIQQEFVETGKVRYAFRNLPLAQIHPQAVGAAEAAACAARQGRFWEMHDRLFEDQQALGPSSLLTHARALGLNLAAFETCLDDGSPRSQIEDDLREADRLGLHSTPTFLIGVTNRDGSVRVVRKIVGAESYEVFQNALSEVAVEAAGSNR